MGMGELQLFNNFEAGFESFGTESRLHDGIRAIGRPSQILTKEGFPGQPLLAGGEVVLTGHTRVQRGVEYMETTYGYYIRRDVLNNAISVLPGEEKTTTRDTTAFARDNMAWVGQTIPAGTRVVFTGDLAAINGQRCGETTDGLYVNLSDTASDEDIRWEQYRAAEARKKQEQEQIKQESFAAREEIRAQIPGIYVRESVDNDFVGVVQEFACDAPFCDENGAPIEVLPLNSRVTLTGNMRDINGVRYAQIGNGKFVKMDNLKDSVEARVDKEIQAALAETNVEEILNTPLSQMSRKFAVWALLKVCGDGPGTRYWLARDNGNGTGFLREMALGLHEGELSFGRVDSIYRTTFQISRESYESCLQVGKGIIESYGISVGDVYSLPAAQQDMVAHVGHISGREDMLGDLMSQITDPSLSWGQVVDLMSRKIQGGITRIGQEVARIMDEPFRNNFPV